MVDLTRMINIDSLRVAAARNLPSMIFDFLEGGAEDEFTVRRNRVSFAEYSLVPRVLVDVGTIDMSVELLGRRIALPVMLSPTGASKTFHPGGELAAARAARAAKTFYSLSTMSNTSLEDVAKAADPKIFQLYVFRDRGITEELIRRAVESGYDALCLTVDMPVGGNRERDVRNRLALPYKPNLSGLMAIARRPRWAANILRTKFEMANFDFQTESRGRHGNMHFVNTQFDPGLTWSDLEWFVSKSGLPVMVKGILSAGDAVQAVNAGARAIMISNHGGRQMDSVPAPLDVLAEIRDAVGSGPEIVLDGGVRRGTDVLKALARGANACSMGRPYLYGLAAAGEAGVARALQILQSELERGMKLMGLTKVSDIGARDIACVSSWSWDTASRTHLRPRSA